MIPAGVPSIFLTTGASKALQQRQCKLHRLTFQVELDGTGKHLQFLKLNQEERFLFISEGYITTVRFGLTVIISGSAPTDTFHSVTIFLNILNFGGENLIAVKVDHSLAADSRWYTGSGIYRDVKIITTEPVHIKQWGIYCKTPEVTPEKAVLSADITVVNETGKNNVNVKVTAPLFTGMRLLEK